MGITNGTLIKQGKYWHWKYRCDGEDRWESLKVTSKREADIKRQQRIAQYHQDNEIFKRERVNPSIEFFEERYFRWAEDHKRPRTIEVERLFWGKLMRFTGAKRVGDIRPRDIERLKMWLKRGGTSGRPLSDVSINNALRHLQAIFNHGIKLGLLTGKNPVQGIARYKVPKTKPDFLSKDEIARLLEASSAYNRQIHWVFLLGIYLGLRKNEIANARWEWFDFDEKLVSVKRGEGFEIKDSEERTIPMSGRVFEALAAHRRESGYLFPRRP